MSAYTINIEQDYRDQFKLKITLEDDVMQKIVQQILTTVAESMEDKDVEAIRHTA